MAVRSTTISAEVRVVPSISMVPLTSGVRPTAVVEPIDSKTSSTRNPAKVAVVSSVTVNSPTVVSTDHSPSIPSIVSTTADSSTRGDRLGKVDLGRGVTGKEPDQTADGQGHDEAEPDGPGEPAAQLLFRSGIRFRLWYRSFPFLSSKSWMQHEPAGWARRCDLPES